jgi:(2Fe-2S) ferredoxin
MGVAVLQEPQHVAYGGVTLDDVDAIADAAARGEVISRLVVHGPGDVLPTLPVQPTTPTEGAP